MTKNFDIPSTWKSHYTKYPHGYSIMEMLADWATKAESMLATLENKTDLTGDHKGTWQGLKPTQTDIGLQATVEDNQNKINIISLFPNSMDSTNNIQQFLDTIPDNSVVRLPPGNYTVEKNDLLAGFPLNDQPCLLLRNKNNVIIDGHGVVLETENHAQGILELHDCNNVYIRGLTLRGCGSYPALDGNTGRGEKGTSTEGYDLPPGLWDYRKNNSYDTQTLTAGGNVPKPWGTFNGGFIGNCGCGLLVKHGCNNIYLDNLDISGFNYSGLQVGWLGDLINPSTGVIDLSGSTLLDINKNIYLINSYIHDCYNAGVLTHYVDGFETLGKNRIERIGHPDASAINTSCDPGYGFANNGYDKCMNKNVSINGCYISDCVRKGIDFHSGYEPVITNNTVINCHVAGIFAKSTTAKQLVTRPLIKNNKLINCGYHTSSGGAIEGGSFSTATGSDLDYYGVVEGNNLINCGTSNVGIINFSSLRGLRIINNNINGVDDNLLPSTAFFGIRIGRTGRTTEECDINNNSISLTSDKLLIGLQLMKVESGIVKDNMLKCAGSNITHGLQLHTCQGVDAFNNIVTLGAVGQPLSLRSTTDGITYNNIGRGGNIPNSTESKVLTASNGRQEFRSMSELKITKTDSLTVDIVSGGGTINTSVGTNGVSNIAQGIKVDFRNLDSGVTPIAVLVNHSSDGLHANTALVGYSYMRETSNQYIVIGLKESPSGAHIALDSLTSAVFSLLIFY